MWYAINWLCAFYMTLFFENNNGIWYGGNYINSCFKQKDLEESKRHILTSGNLLLSYRNLFRPIFRHQHSTYIKYPLVQQTDKVDFNYLNKRLSARENRFEHIPQYDFRTGKNYDSFYSTKQLSPNYKVLIKPFFSRTNVPPNIGESEYFVKTHPNRRPFESEINMKGTRESQYFNYAVKKRKPIHRKKIYQIKTSTHSDEAVGGLFLPSKIILSNFSSWKWKNKKEIQTNNLSLSMVYDLLLPKYTADRAFKNSFISFCTTTKGESDISLDELSGHQSSSEARKVISTCCSLAHIDKAGSQNKEKHINKSVEEVANEYDENIVSTEKSSEKTKLLNNVMGNEVFSTCFSGCGCKTNNKNQITLGSLTKPLESTTKVPMIFKFEDYFCECYSSPSNVRFPKNQKKGNGDEEKRKDYKMKGKENPNFLKNKGPQSNFKKINNESSGVIMKTAKDDTTVNNNENRESINDGVNIAEYIIISNDDVIDPDVDDPADYYFGKKISPFTTDSFNINERSTENFRIKRKTFKCQSKWNCKRKREFVPFQNYLRQSSASFVSSTSYLSSTCISNKLKNRRLIIRKMNRHKNRRFAKRLKNIINKDLSFEFPSNIITKCKIISLNNENEKNSGHKKREFIGQDQVINTTDFCEEFQEISASENPITIECSKTAFLESITAIPTSYCSIQSPSTMLTFIQSHSSVQSPSSVRFRFSKHPPPSKQSSSAVSIATLPVSIDRSTHSDLGMVQITTEIKTMEIPTDEGPKFRPDTGNLHPAKLFCEKQFKRECICSVTIVLEEINYLIATNDDQKHLLSQLTKYNCTRYIPVEINYKMSPELKPRLISNKHKELLVDEKNGPKEIIDDTFQELLIRDMANEETDVYIFPSTNVEIPCFVNNDVQLSPNTADSPTYVWRQKDNKIITDGRVIEDLNHRGMLQILEATLADSDNYTCTVNYTNPDTGMTVSDSFVHSVMVVTLPKLALHTLLHYSAKVKCDQETLEMFELYLPQQIEDYICYIEPNRRKICTVEIHNPICHPKNNELQNVDLKSVWKYRNKGVRQNAATSQENDGNIMELSLNFELDIDDVTQTMTSAANKTRCGPFCQLKIILKVVDILRESFTIVLPHPVNSSGGAIFQPDVNSINMKILIACEGGFKLIQGFCMPCPANTYSEEGSTECSKCLSGTYQPNIGSRSCEACPHPFKAGCSTLWFSPAVIAVTIISVLLIILVSTIMVYFCKYFIANCLSSCITRRFKKKYFENKELKPKEIFSRKGLKKKIRKLSPRGKKEVASEPPTLPSEDFTS